MTRLLNLAAAIVALCSAAGASIPDETKGKRV